METEIKSDCNYVTEGGSRNAPTCFMDIYINGIRWKLIFTSKSADLELGGTVRLGVTDKANLTIYINSGIRNSLLRKVLLHELTHAYLYSYGYEFDVLFEELLCEFVDTHSDGIGALTDEILDT